MRDPVNSSRLCIYTIYDVQSTINPYIGEVLKELKHFSSTIYVVCNFDKACNGVEYVFPYADRVFFRENKGFDSGAYKHVLTECIMKSELYDHDELILTNDTYFAPLFPFDEMFETMRKAPCDFWGITRHPGGYNICLGDFETHIQSYFFVFKDRAFHNSAFERFWQEFVPGNNKAEAVERFELGINRCMLREGFVGKAYTDMLDPPLILQRGVNPYMELACELITDYRIPVIKKTNFYGKNPYLLNALKALDYIGNKCRYDVSLIKGYIEEYRKKGLIGPYYDLDALEAFAKNHDRVFIYGAGVWGHNADNYLRNRGIIPAGFIVTCSDTDEIMEFSECVFLDNDGIVIAQENKDVCDEIRKSIGNCVSDDMIFTPVYPQIYDQ